MAVASTRRSGCLCSTTPLVLLCAALLATPAWADPVASGFTWLLSKQSPSGTFGDTTAEEPVVATSEALAALKAAGLGPSESQSALTALSLAPASPDVELLLRRAEALAGTPFALTAPTSRAHAPGFEAEELPVMLWRLRALQAGGQAGGPDAVLLARAIAQRALPSGCHAFADSDASVELTATVAEALRAESFDPVLALARQRALACLALLQAAGGSFGGADATALAAVALAHADGSFAAAVTAARGYLLATQQADGSWGSVRATSLALRALLADVPDWEMHRQFQGRALLQLTPGEVLQGQSVTATVDVRNLAGVAAPAAPVRLTAVPAAGGPAILLADATLPPLGAGQSALVPVTFSTSGLSGQYAVTAEVDALHLLAELDRTNDTATGTLNVVVAYDVAISSGSLTFQAGPTPDTAVVSVAVRNLGATTPIALTVALTKGAATTGVALGTFSVPAGLAQNAVASGSVTFSTVGMNGFTAILAQVDPGNQLAESDKSNNTALRYFEKGAVLPVDVSVGYSDFAPRGQVVAGQPIVVSGVVHNLSANDAHSVVVRFTSAADLSLLGETTVDVVPALGTAPVTLTMTVTDNTTVQVALDPDGALVDTNRYNNTSAFSLLPGQQTNLTMLYVSSSGWANPGDMAYLNVAVRNLGATTVTTVVTVASGPTRTEVGQVPVVLAPNETRLATLGRYATPPGGTAVFQACVDKVNAITESNKNDNCAELSLGAVTAELSVSAGDIAFQPVGADVGEAVHATAVVRNLRATDSTAVVEWWQGYPQGGPARRLGLSNVSVLANGQATVSLDFIRQAGPPEVYVRITAMQPAMAGFTKHLVAGRHLFLEDVVSLATAAYPSTAIEARTVRVGRLDGPTGPPQVVVGYRRGFGYYAEAWGVEVLDRQPDGHYTVRWQQDWPTSDRMLQDVVLLDVDGDGRGEVVTLTAARPTAPSGPVPPSFSTFAVYDAQGALKWSQQWVNGIVGPLDESSELGVGDIDGDGRVDLITSDTHVRAFTAATGAAILDVPMTWRTGPMLLQSMVSTLDVDGSGALKLYVDTPAFGRALLNANGTPRWVTDYTHSGNTNTALVDFTLSGAPTGVQSLGDTTDLFDLDGGTIRSAPYGISEHLAAGALRQDGLPYVVGGLWGRTQVGGVVAFSGEPRTLWQRVPQPLPISAINTNYDDMNDVTTLADLYGKGRPQVILSACEHAFSILEGRTGADLVQRGDGDLSNGCSVPYRNTNPAVVADLTGGGGTRVVVPTTGGANFFNVDFNDRPSYGPAEVLIFRSPHWQAMPPTWPTRNLIHGQIDDNLHFVGGAASHRWWTTHNTYNQQFLTSPSRLLPDFAASVPAQGPATAGQPFALAATLRNVGGLAASNVPLSLYDGVPGRGGRLLSRVVVPGPLAVRGGTAPVTLNWTAFPEGQHTLCVVADEDGSVEESGAENNQACAPLFVRPPGPSCDYAFVDNSLSYGPPGVLPGQTLTLSATVTNLGGLDCPATTLAVVDGPPGNQVPVGTAVVPATAVGATATVTLSALAQPGTRLWRFTLDDLAPMDGDASNNTATLTGLVSGATLPDLSVVAAAVSPSPAFPGEAVAVHLTVRNGGAPSVPTTVSLATGESAAVPGLAGGELAAVTLTTTAPALPAVLVATVDPANLVPELDESNNALAFSLPVVASGVSLAVAPTPATAGPNTAVAVPVTGTVSGALARQVAVTAVVLSPAGAVVGTVAAGASLLVPQAGSASLPLVWNTGAVAPGTYTVHATALESGRLVASADAAVVVTVGVQTAVAALAPDRGTYAPRDAVLLSFAVDNTSGNLTLNGAQATLQVLDPSGVALSGEVRQLPQLQAGGRFTGTAVFQVSPNAAPGAYRATLAVTQGAAALAQAQAAFAVQVVPVRQVTATVIAPSSFQVTFPVPVSVQLANAGSVAVANEVLAVELYDAGGATLTLDSAASAIVSVPAGGTLTQPLVLSTSTMAPGTKLLVVRLGNRVLSRQSLTAIPVVDRTPPAITVTGVSDLLATNHDVTPVITVTDASALTWSAALDGVPFASGTVVSAEGAHVLDVAAQDVWGNASALHLRFTLDKTPPALTLSGVANGAFVNAAVTLTFSATDALTAVTTTSTLDGAPFTSGTAVSAEGTHVWVVTATDAAGNTSAQTRTFTVDLTPPALWVAGVTAGAFVNAPVTLTFGATDASPVTVTATLDGAPFTSGGAVSAEGLHTLAVTATDAAGNGAGSTVAFTVDLTPPVVTLSGVTDGQLTNAPVSPAFGATDAHLATVSATLNGAPFASGTAVSADGAWALLVTATDLAGNTATAGATFTIDTAPPVITILGVAEGAVMATPVAIVYSASDLHAGSVSATLDGAAFASGSAVTAEGVHLLLVSAADAAGNAATATRHFTVDLTPPSVTVTGVSDGLLVNHAVTPVISVTDLTATTTAATLNGATFAGGTAVSAEGDAVLVVTATDAAAHTTTVTVRFTIDTTPPLVTISGVAEGALASAPVTLSFGATDAHPLTPAATATLDGAPFASGGTVSTDGVHALVVTATDGAGNTATATRSFTLDTTPPVVTVTGVTDGQLVNHPVAPAFTVTDATATASVATLNGAAFVSGTTVSAEGDFVLVVTATDAVGHTTTATVHFTIDTTPPVIQLTALSSNAYFNAPVAPVYSATDAHPGAVTATLDGAPYASGTPITAAGAHLLVVTATDGAGNVSRLSVPFTLDFTAPAITISGVTQGATAPSFAPVVTVADASPTTTVVTLDGAPFTSGATVSAAGAHALAVTATDAAGNTAGAAVSFTVAASACLDTTLVARREYRPSHWQDGVLCNSAPFSFVVPATLPVTQGNAGNKTAWLFVSSSGHTTACRYRGGSPVAHPRRAADVAAGLAYHLACCTGGTARAGATVAADTLRLHVHDGDDRAGPTQVEWQFQESRPCSQGSATDGGICAQPHGRREDGDRWQGEDEDEDEVSRKCGDDEGHPGLDGHDDWHHE